jgi:hypothetical protein
VNPKTFFAELNRRNVYKVTIAANTLKLSHNAAAPLRDGFDVDRWGAERRG